jgi:ATP-binding cassette subfamily A (ABC1) protein 3
LDEADKLGDRVAIMAHGKLMCCGSPLFLKNRFGVGYTLTVVKLGQGKTNSENLAAISSRITLLITSFIPSAEPLSDVGAEQSFRLPFSASSRFVELFETLDQRKTELKIAEYGISVTTLEEVFLKVADLEDENDLSEDGVVKTEVGDNESQQAKSDHPIVQKLSGDLKGTKGDEHLEIGSVSPKQALLNSNYIDIEDTEPFWRHFKALLIKRAIYAKRDTRMIICQLILPVILIILGLSLLLIRPDLNQPDFVLSPAKFNPDFNSLKQNFVPYQVNSACDTGVKMMERFNGNSEDGIFGVGIPISDFVDSGDPFAGCAQGANPLYNMSQYLLNTPQPALQQESGSTVYGSVTIADGTNDTFLNYNVLVNGSALHAAGIYMNLVHQSFLQVISGVPTATITAHNYPLPQTFKQENQSAAIDAFVVSLFAMIAMCFIPASFAVFVVKEREVKAKHQQVISGVSIYAYWVSTFFWDTISYLPTALLVIAIMYAYGIEAYTKGPAASAIVVLVLLYGPATAAFTYIISFLFVSHSTAQVAVMFFNFVTGLCLMVVSFVLTTIPSTSEDNLKLRYIFRLFPSYCIGDGIAQLALCSQGKDCPTIDKNGYNFEHFQDPFSWDTAGGDIVFLAIEVVVYFLIAVAIEYSLTFPTLMAWLYRMEDAGVTPSELADDDVDVAEERRRVASGAADRDIVKIQELRKLYPANSRAGGVNLGSLFCPPDKDNTKVAVHCLSFGIPRGECFGFLGINGAGKTTTLSILSGEFPPTGGNAYVDGFSISVDQSKIRRKIGYCPQFDALLELLTVREHLELYGRIKGFQGDLLGEIVTKKLHQLDLKDFEHKTAGSLSGGNKRKLSVAVATVGDPPIVFLDEPSTGMDPK